MRIAWTVLALAGMLGGCAKAPRLDYDLAGLTGVGGGCATSAKTGCDSLSSAIWPQSTPQRQPPATAASTPLPPAATVIVPKGTVKLVVSLSQQRLYAFQDGVLIATSAVSTGKRGHATPVGFFHIMQKQVHHRSNRYSNAPMPYMQRLTASGVALHAGNLPGYPASHGCIRMPLGFAKRLYRLTSFRSTVTVTRARISSPTKALKLK